MADQEPDIKRQGSRRNHLASRPRTHLETHTAESLLSGAESEAYEHLADEIAAVAVAGYEARP